MPSMSSAPSTRFTPRASQSALPLSDSAVPPTGMRLSCATVMNSAATSSAVPIPSWIGRRGRRDTMPAPSHPPTSAVTIMRSRSMGSIWTAEMKINACTTTVSASPTSMVDGSRSSGTMRSALNVAVVVASDPMPSVSRKLTRKPISSCTGVGQSRSPDARSIDCHHRHEKSAARRTMALSRTTRMSGMRLRYLAVRGAAGADSRCLTQAVIRRRSSARGHRPRANEVRAAT